MNTQTILGAGLTIAGALARAGTALADDVFVSSAAEISAAMQNAQPGDALIMTNGDW